MYGRQTGIQIGGPITPVVKKLMIFNGAIFLIQQVANLISPGLMVSLFGLSHVGLFHKFMLWQPLTYMFLHGSWLHIFFNLFGLWMFAGELENTYGSRFFLKFYIYSGIGAGIFIAAMNFLMFTRTGASPSTVGASGALYAILLAYGMTWPNRQVMLYFIIPVKIKYLVAVFGLIEFFGTLSSARGLSGNVSHIGHLGGLISGFIILYFASRRDAKKDDRNSMIEEYRKKKRIQKKQEQIDTRIKAKKIIDELLEKIAREGMGALSAQEKKDLEWARKNYYPGKDESIH